MKFWWPIITILGFVLSFSFSFLLFLYLNFFFLFEVDIDGIHESVSESLHYRKNIISVLGHVLLSIHCSLIGRTLWCCGNGWVNFLAFQGMNSLRVFNINLFRKVLALRCISQNFLSTLTFICGTFNRYKNWFCVFYLKK